MLLQSSSIFLTINSFPIVIEYNWRQRAGWRLAKCLPSEPCGVGGAMGEGGGWVTGWRRKAVSAPVLLCP